MDLISQNFDDGSIKLVDPRIISAETSQKDNLCLGEAMKTNYREYFMKAMGKETKYLTTEDFGEYFQNHPFQLQHI